MSTATNIAAVQATGAGTPRASILARMAERYHVEPNRLLETLRATAFKGTVNNEQMVALLIVADQYGLNPFTKEIYAFPDKGGIVPVVGVDGWARIINAHPQFDGMTFHYEGEGADLCCTCVIFRKDRSHPVEVSEYMHECRRGTQPWQSHPRRMLRHKTMIQAARIAFGFAGIHDPDEAERIRDMGMAEEVPPTEAAKPGGVGAAAKLKTAATRPAARSPRAAASASAQAPTLIDADTGEVAPSAPPSFDYAAAHERVQRCADAEVLALMADEWRDLPDGEAKDDLMTLVAGRMRELEG